MPPPAPIAPPPDFTLHAFDQAVTALKQLLTKPAAQFASTVHSASDLEGVRTFIRDVADRASKARLPKCATVINEKESKPSTRQVQN